MRVRVVKTRPPFDHAKHIRLSGQTLLLWAVTGYPVAYLWHRFGPTKSVSYVSSEGFHRMAEYSRQDAVYTQALYQQPNPEYYTDPQGRAWSFDQSTGQWVFAGWVICAPGRCSS